MVTGATGFIGREIVRELIDAGIFVIQIGNSQKNFAEFDAKSEFYNADLSEYENLKKLEKLAEIEAVVHSAGLAHQFKDTKKEAFEAVNVKGTENAARLAVKLNAKHFVLISSTAVYGIKRGKINENAVCEPETLYAESKLKAEKVCRQICEENAVKLTILRLAPVIGEANVGNAARLIEAIYKKRFVWIGKGENLKTLIYKKDVARAVLTILKNTENGRSDAEIFNLAAEPIRMKNFVCEIEKHLNRKTPPMFVPPYILRKIFYLNSKTFKFKKARKLAETLEKWLSDDVYTADKIKSAYNFRTKTSIAEGIEKQINHYLSARRK